MAVWATYVCALGHGALDLDRALHGVDRAANSTTRVADQLDSASVIRVDLRLDELLTQP